MPQIIIRETDKTKPGLSEYSNFAVLVPGYVIGRELHSDGKYYYGGYEPSVYETPAQAEAAGKTLKGIFDDNGCAELTNLDDFEIYIGKKDAISTSIVNHAPTFSYLETICDQDTGEEGTGTVKTKYWKAKVTAHEFYNDFNGQLYTLTEGQIAEDGKLKCAQNSANNDPATIYHIVDEQEVLYPYYREGTYVLAEKWVKGTEYFRILPNDKGNDYIAANPQMGNQIAYELLKLGYTVLYVELDPAKLLAPTGTHTDVYANESQFWAAYKDKATYDFRYVVSGFSGAWKDYISISMRLAELATDRGDCINLIDVPEEWYIGVSNWKSTVITGVNTMSFADKYSAIFMPTVTYNMAEDAVYTGNKFPGYFHYLLCASEAFVNYPEWFAVAGYTRGVASTYSIKGVSLKLGDAAVNALEPRKKQDDLTKSVNVIANIKGATYIWGNRTANTLGDTTLSDLVASHFLNIRQLCSTLKKQIYVACRRFTFDPNSDVLWINFTGAISPLLDRMKANQGIDDYRIIKVPTDKKATLKAKIRIVPIEAVEDFEIDLFLEDSIVGANVEIDESTGTN